MSDCMNFVLAGTQNGLALYRKPKRDGRPVIANNEHQRDDMLVMVDSDEEKPASTTESTTLKKMSLGK